MANPELEKVLEAAWLKGSLLANTHKTFHFHKTLLVARKFKLFDE
jgi:hypothetical protein